jgi:prepilin-type N-terminal cleavage/methylation domain-containing protein
MRGEREALMPRSNGLFEVIQDLHRIKLPLHGFSRRKRWICAHLSHDFRPSGQKCANQVNRGSKSPRGALAQYRPVNVDANMFMRKSHLRSINARKPGACRQGFTLVELLVVLVVIAVQAIVIAVVLPRMMKRSRAAGCIQILRQIGTMMNSHATENNGSFPPAGTSDGCVRRLCRKAFADSYPDTGGPKDAPFFRKDGAGSFFVCPSNKEAWKDPEKIKKSYLANSKIVGDTAMNESPDGKPIYRQFFEPKALASIGDASRAFLIIEDWRKNKDAIWRGNDQRYKPTSNDNCAAHGEGRHYLFVHGHVRMIVKDPGRNPMPVFASTTREKPSDSA